MQLPGQGATLTYDCDSDDEHTVTATAVFVDLGGRSGSVGQANRASTVLGG